MLVTVAESAAEGAHYTAAPLAGDHELESTDVLRVAKHVEKAGKIAMSSCSACADFLVQKRPQIDEADGIRAETTANLLALQPRIQHATRQATEALQQAAMQKQKIAAKIALLKRAEKIQGLFQKYDEDKDGFLNRKEIQAFSKAEFNFELPEENLDRMSRHLFRGDNPGVNAEDYQLLKSSVGIAREEARSEVRRQERLKREEVERVLAEKRKELVKEKHKELVEPATKILEELE